MRNSVICFIPALFLLVLCPKAEATCADLVEWNFSLETYGANYSWDSIKNVTPGCPQYIYSWALDSAELQVFGIGWHNIMDHIPIGHKSSSGTVPSIPFIAFDEDVGESGIFTAHVIAYVNTEGFLTVFMTDVRFGQIDIDGIRDVIGFQCSGHATIIPEPATLSLLALGGILLRQKRRAQRALSGFETGF